MSLTESPYKFPIRCPAEATLKQQLKISAQSAKAIRLACASGNPITALKLADKAMGGYGVENLYPEFPHFSYVNMGDTYSRTLYLNGNTLQIGTWGDFVEKHGRY